MHLFFECVNNVVSILIFSFDKSRFDNLHMCYVYNLQNFPKETKLAVVATATILFNYFFLWCILFFSAQLFCLYFFLLITVTLHITL